MFRAIYLDHNATTPYHPELKTKVLEWIGQESSPWGNPSSIHWAGRGPKGLLRTARAQMAEMLGVEPLELIFTGSGSEANNLALKGLCDIGGSLRPGRDQIIISAVEHPSVRKTADYLGARGFKIDYVPVSRQGELNLEVLESLLSDRTALVSIMLANNETGHIFPLKQVVEMAHARGALVHSDVVQAFGKIPLNLRELGVDLASISGHKFYAFKGAGVLYARKGLSLTSLIHGGGQERGRRAGTENIVAIASLGFMAGKRAEILPQMQRLQKMRDAMEDRILKEITDVKITGREGLRLPGVSSLTLAGIDGETLLMNMDVRGYAVSTGAACSAGNPEPSPTLLAMGLTRAEAQSSLRISLGWGTTEQELEAFVETLKAVVIRLRGFKHGERFAYGV